MLDNLKEGVVKPDLYEPRLNAVYAATLAHYGVIADPARVRDPNRKGSVESAIGHTQATALKGRRFESLVEQNDFLEHWENRWAASRIHGSRKLWGIARLADRYPRRLVDRACAQAMHEGIHSYSHVRQGWAPSTNRSRR
ncbi:hypothetical protein SAMN05444680_11826 [Variovorax sp. YR216]|nr:hypothetical protein SAMN05444680_11826 [Variovorax sp. YR216]